MKQTALTVAISLLLLGTTPDKALALYEETQPTSETQASGNTAGQALPSESTTSSEKEPVVSSELTTPSGSTSGSEQPTTETVPSGATTPSSVASGSTGTVISSGSTGTVTSSGSTSTTTSISTTMPSGPMTASETATTTTTRPTPTESETATTTTRPTPTETANTTTTTRPTPSETANTTTTTRPTPTETANTTTTTRPTPTGTVATTTTGKPTQTGTTATQSGSTVPKEQPSNPGTANNTPCNCAKGQQPTQVGPATTQTGKPPQGGTAASGKPNGQAGQNVQSCGQPSPCGQQRPQGGQNAQPGATAQAGSATSGGQVATCGKRPQGSHSHSPCNQSQRPKLQDFGIIPTLVETFTQLPQAALQAFSAHQMGRVPPKAFQEMTAQQMQELPNEAVSGLTPEQFQEMPPEALQGLTADNMPGLSPQVIGKFKPKHFAHLNPQQVQQMSSVGISKLLAQCDSTQVKPADVKDLLPAGWKLNPEDGTLQPPAGTQLALPTKTTSQQQSSAVKLPQNLPDLSKGFGVGGRHPAGQSVLTGLNQGLAQAGYPQFTLQQSEQGIVIVKGSAQFQGVDLTFIPGKEMTQADDTTATGLSTNDSGQYVVTTPEKQQFPVVPAPKDPAAMSEALGGDGSVEVGPEGDILLQDTTHQQTVVGICDPVVTPAPANAKPGLHLTQSQNGKQQGQFVYKDGTMQTLHPTVPEPAQFVEQTMATFDGVEKVVHRKDDGSFDITVNGQNWSAKPNFEVTEETLPDTQEDDVVDPQVTVCSQQPSCLEYTVPHGKKLLKMKLQISPQ